MKKNDKKILEDYGFWTFNTYILPYIWVLGGIFIIGYPVINKVGSSVGVGSSASGTFFILSVSVILTAVAYYFKNRNKYNILERMKNEE
jgi:hypothetical protein